MEAEEVADLFKRSKHAGLDLTLACSVPMHFEEWDLSEDLSPGEVAHIIVMLIKDPQVDERAIRAELAHVSGAYREITDGPFIHDNDITCNLRTFRKLLPLLASLMRIDLDYVVAHFVYQVTAVSELPVTLICILREKCGSEGIGQPLPLLQIGDGLDLRIVDEPFTLKLFAMLAHKTGIIDNQGKGGVPYSEVQLVYQRAQLGMAKSREIRNKNRKRKKGTGEGPRDKEAPIFGRGEFSVLMEELWKRPEIKSLFPSPLHMCVRFVDNASSLIGTKEDRVAAARQENATQLQPSTIKAWH